MRKTNREKKVRISLIWFLQNRQRQKKTFFFIYFNANDVIKQSVMHAEERVAHVHKHCEEKEEKNANYVKIIIRMKNNKKKQKKTNEKKIAS